MNESKHKYLDNQIIIMYKGGKSMAKIAKELGLQSSTIGYRVKILSVSRSISESLVGQARIKSEVAKGSRNLKEAKFHSDELLETLTVNDEGNQQPSLQSRKVQRLLENSDVLNNQIQRPTR